MKKPHPKKAKKAVAVKKNAVNSSVAKKVKNSSKNSVVVEQPIGKDELAGKAGNIADEMIEIACQYAEKWRTTSDIGFVTTYGHTDQSDSVLNVVDLEARLKIQKENLIDTIRNNGVVRQGNIKHGTIYNLNTDEIEDTIFQIFVDYMKRLGIAVASEEYVTNVLEQVFVGSRNFWNINYLNEGGISSNIAGVAVFSYFNLKPAYKGGVEGWRRLFEKLNEAYESKNEESLDELDDDFFEIENDSEDIPDVDGAEEGALEYREHLIRERNRSLIQKKKEMATSLSCEVCGFDFEEKYGDLGEGYCEVHHKIPLSLLKKSTKTKLEDLAIVCSNCHRMLHRRRDEILTIDELRRLLNE